MKKLLLTLFVVSLFGQIEVKIKKTLIIDTSKDEVNINLVKINTLEIDNNKHLYVLSNDVFIRQYDPNLKFLGNIGKKGEGPGETKYLNEFSLDHNNNLLLKNPFQRKLNIYSSEGKYLDYFDYTKNTKEFAPSKIRMISKKRYLAFNSIAPEQNKMLYCITNDKYNIINSFGKISEIYPKKNDDYMLFLGENSFLEIKEKEIWIAPKLYKNTLSIFSKIDKKYISKQINGFDIKKQPLNKISEKEFESSLKTKYAFYDKDGNGKHYEINSNTLGLVKYKENYVLHIFSYYVKTDTYKLAINIFDLNGKLIDTKVIEEKDNLNYPKFYYKTFNGNQYYVIESVDGIDYIKKYEVEITGLK